MKILNQEYPDNPVFAKNKDKNGNTYLNCYANKETTAIVSVGEKNHVFSGNPSISFRKGNSKFGEEFILHFLVKEIKETYDKNTGHKRIEIYLPKDFGLQFLQDSINFIKTNKEATQ